MANTFTGNATVAVADGIATITKVGGLGFSLLTPGSLIQIGGGFGFVASNNGTVITTSPGWFGPACVVATAWTGAPPASLQTITNKSLEIAQNLNELNDLPDGRLLSAAAKDSLIGIDALTSLFVLGVGTVLPPATPAETDAYLVGDGATGSWAGYDGTVAYFLGGEWQFRAPFDGLTVKAATGEVMTYTDGWKVQHIDGRLLGLTSNVGDRVSNTTKLKAALAAALVHDVFYEHPPGLVVPLDSEIDLSLSPKINANGGVWSLTDASGVFPAREGALGHCVRSFGAITNLPALATLPVKGATTLAYVSAPPVEPGDVIVIASTALWNPVRAYYNRGEFVTVKEVVGNNALLRTPLRDDYSVGAPAPAVTTGLMTQNNAIIRDLTIIGDAAVGTNKVLALGNLGPDAVIENVKVVCAHGRSAFEVQFSCGARFVNCQAINSRADDAGNTYALVIGNSQDVTFEGGYAYNSSWHGFSVGGGNPPWNVVNRNIHVRKMMIVHQCGSAHPVVAADMHGNAENCVFEDCTIIGGVEVGGHNNRIVGGGTIIKAGSTFGMAEVAIFLSEPMSWDHLVGEGVRIEVDSISAAGNGIALDLESYMGGARAGQFGGTFKFYADVHYNVSGVAATAQRLVLAKNTDYSVPVPNPNHLQPLGLDLSRARFTFDGINNTTACPIGGIVVAGLAAYPIHAVKLPEPRSTFFGYFSEVLHLNGDNMAFDQIGIDRRAPPAGEDFTFYQPGIRVQATQFYTYSFNNVKFFGGQGAIIMSYGAGQNCRGSIMGLLVHAIPKYTDGAAVVHYNYPQALYISSAGQLLAGNSVLSGCGGVFAGLDRFVWHEGVYDGPIDGAGCTLFKRVLASPAVLEVDLNGAAQGSLSTNAYNKILFTHVVTDTDGWWDAVNKRVTPNVPCRLQITLNVMLSGSAMAQTGIPSIYKNGAAAHSGTSTTPTSATIDYSRVVAPAVEVDCNGTTDYIEPFVYAPTGVTSINGVPAVTYMQVRRVR
jgi:hypothetical protein